MTTKTNKRKAVFIDSYVDLIVPLLKPGEDIPDFVRSSLSYYIEYRQQEKKVKP